MVTLWAFAVLHESVLEPPFVMDDGDAVKSSQTGAGLVCGWMVTVTEALQEAVPPGPVTVMV
jgi:hypothetical protein